MNTRPIISSAHLLSFKRRPHVHFGKFSLTSFISRVDGEIRQVFALTSLLVEKLQHASFSIRRFEKTCHFFPSTRANKTCQGQPVKDNLSRWKLARVDETLLNGEGNAAQAHPHGIHVRRDHTTWNQLSPDKTLFVGAETELGVGEHCGRHSRLVDTRQIIS